MVGPDGLRAELLGLFLVVGAGTYLMRALPLLAALGRLRGHGSFRSGSGTSSEGDGRVCEALGLVAPSVIAALLVSSLVPAPSAPGFWRELAPGALALVPTWFVAARWRHLGLTVLVGVAAFWTLRALSLAF